MCRGLIWYCYRMPLKSGLIFLYAAGSKNAAITFFIVGVCIWFKSLWHLFYFIRDIKIYKYINSYKHLVYIFVSVYIYIYIIIIEAFVVGSGWAFLLDCETVQVAGKTSQFILNLWVCIYSFSHRDMYILSII